MAIIGQPLYEVIELLCKLLRDMEIVILFNAEGLVPTILHNMIINAIIRATESNCV
jgi:hypothetical protein